MAKQPPEISRFVAYYKTYAEETPQLAMFAKLSAQSGGGGSTGAATATKTMATRKQLNGSKGHSDSGLQNVREAGRARTASGSVKQ